MIDDPDIDLDDQVSGKLYDPHVVGRLSRYLRPYLPHVVVGAVLLIVLSGLEIVGPLILREAIDGQIASRKTDRLGLLVALYLSTLVGMFTIRYVQSVMMNYVGQRVMTDLRMEIFSHLQKMSIAFFDRNPVGRLVTRLTNDVSTLEQLISQGVVQILANLLTVLAVMVAMLLLDWKLALVMYAFLPPLIYAVRFFAFTQRDGYREQRAWLSRINADLNENITGMAVVQLFNREKENLRKFDRRNRGLLGANLMVLRWYAIFEPTVVIFGAVTTGVILWYGGGSVVQRTLTLGDLVAFVLYSQRFFRPISDMSEKFNVLQNRLINWPKILKAI